MDFYTTVLLVAVILLILALTSIGLMLSNGNYGKDAENNCPNKGSVNPNDSNNKTCNSY